MDTGRQKPLKLNLFNKLQWRHGVLIVVIGLSIYVVASQIEKIRQSFTVALTSNLLFLSLAMVCIALTYLTAAGLYWALCQRKIHYRELWLVEIATGFSSRLLPAGIGGIAVNIRFLHRKLNKGVHSAAIVGLNNIIGFSSYVSLGLVALALSHRANELRQLQPPRYLWLVLGGMAVIVILALGISTWAKRRISIVISELRILLIDYRGRPTDLFWAYIMALGTTIFYIGAFYLCVRAVGAQVTLLQAVAVFALGLGGGAVAPTPGGLGGVEAGLYGGLYAVGLRGPEALSAVLLYRLLSYWLPMIPGFVIFRNLLKQKII